MDRINYVDQLDAFWNIAQLNPEIKSTHKTVYLALLHINSQNNWSTEFEVSSNQILNLLRVHTNIFINSLEFLKSIGLIENLVIGSTNYLPIKIVLKVLKKDSK